MYCKYVVLMLLLCAPLHAADRVTVGMSAADVVAMCGQPCGTGRCASESWWFYGPSRVAFVGSSVARIDTCFAWPQVITPGSAPKVLPALDYRVSSADWEPACAEVVYDAPIHHSPHPPAVAQRHDRTQHVSGYVTRRGTRVAPYRRRPSRWLMENQGNSISRFAAQTSTTSRTTSILYRPHSSGYNPCMTSPRTASTATRYRATGRTMADSVVRISPALCGPSRTRTGKNPGNTENAFSRFLVPRLALCDIYRRAAPPTEGRSSC